MNKNLLVGLFVAIALVGAGGFYFSQRSGQTETAGDSAVLDVKEESVMMKEGYNGQLLAGDSSPFLTFNQEDYDKTLSEDKIVFLEFYANWCPVCRAEAPIIHSGFDNLEADNVVGFRVNFNDSDTDSDEKALAKEFSVPYQYTKIILKDGEEVFRDTTGWRSGDFEKAFGGVI
jgi:thioredoxin 1